MQCTSEIYQQILSLKQNGLTRQQIADKLGLSFRQVKRYLTKKAQAPLAEIHTKQNIETFIPIEDLVDDLKRQKERQVISDTFSGVDSILQISDLHIPFQHLVAIKSLQPKVKDFDIIVINGDFFDLYLYSKFIKYKSIGLKQELDIGNKIIEILAGINKRVVILAGNHDARLRKYIADRVHPELLELFCDGNVFAPLNKLPNVTTTQSWWIKINDCIFAHPDNFSKIPGRTVVNTSTYFLGRQIDHRGCVIGHTHKVISLMYRGIWLMEAGCLSYEQDYSRDAKMTYDPWQLGYGEIYFKGGKIDATRSRPVIIEV